jgi:hypothetical protein
MRARAALVLIRGRSARPARAACARAAGGQPARRKQPRPTRRRDQPARRAQPHPTRREVSRLRKSGSMPARQGGQPVAQEQLAHATGDQPARRKQPCPATERSARPASATSLHATERSTRHARAACPHATGGQPVARAACPRATGRSASSAKATFAHATERSASRESSLPARRGSLPTRRAQLSLSHLTNTKRDAPEAPLLRGHPSHQRRDSAAQKTQAISVEDLAKRVEVAGGRVATGDDTLPLTGAGDEAAAGVTGLAPDVGRGQP